MRDLRYRLENSMSAIVEKVKLCDEGRLVRRTQQHQ